MKPVFVGLVLIVYVNVTSSAPLTSSSHVIKSQNDGNEYKLVNLSNGILCALVYDAEAEDTALELRVGVGYKDEEIPGIAHFVEHMLFEGSTQYPDGSVYQRYISEHNGYYNGQTWETGTSYTYRIGTEFWQFPAKILASAISSPEFNKEDFSSAIRAVDSEYKMSLSSEYRRLISLAKLLGNPDSGYYPFSVGSSKTLNQPDIFDKVRQFHDRYYSANLITLAIVSNTTLNRLEDQVEDIFGSIPNKNRTRPHNPSLLFPSLRDGSGQELYLNKVVYYNKKSVGQHLVYQFPVQVPNLFDISYLEHVVDFSGEGSISHYLLSRGYITHFSVLNTLVDRNSNHVVLYIKPTESGLLNIDMITETVFKYFKSAFEGGVNVDLWRSIKKMEELTFRFSNKLRPLQLVGLMLDNLEHSVHPADLLGAPLRAVLDVERENQILEAFRPDNFNLFVCSDSFSNETHTEVGPRLGKVEQYYGTLYHTTPMSRDFVDRLKNLQPDPLLVPPSPVKVVPSNFEMFKVEDGATKDPTEIRSLENDGVSVWWLQDQWFNQPKVDTACTAYTAHPDTSPKGEIATEIIAQMLELVHEAKLSDITQVKYSPGFHLDTFSVFFSLEGYSDPTSMTRALNILLDVFFNLQFNLSDDMFNQTVKVPIEQSLLHPDSSFEQAYKLIKNLLAVEYTKRESYLEALRSISQHEARQFMETFLSNVTVICDTMGNARKSDALKYSEIFVEKLRDQGSHISRQDRRDNDEQPYYVIPRPVSYVMRSPTEDKTNLNSANVVLYLFENSKHGFPNKPPYFVGAIAELLGLFISQTCFQYLRTEKQLGYQAGCSSFNTRRSDRVAGFRVYVQGSRADAGPDVMDQEIANLLNAQWDVFQNLSTSKEGLEKMEDLKAVLIDELSVTPRSLNGIVWDVRAHIYDSVEIDFLIKEQLITALKAVTLTDVIEFYGSYIMGDEKRRISSQVFGKDNMVPNEVMAEQTLIPEIEEFQKTMFVAQNQTRRKRYVKRTSRILGEQLE